MADLNEKIDLWQQQNCSITPRLDAAIKRMLDASKLASVPARVTVFRPQDRCENYLLVTAGKVKVSLLTPSGHELLLYRVEPGESCVLTTTCLMASKPYPAEGVTETEVTALMIPKTAFDQALAESDSFRQIVFDHLSHRFADIIARIETVKFSDLDTRLADQLLRQMSPEHIVAATHQALAAEIGTSREVVSRHLKELEHRGMIRLGRGRINVVDVAALRGIAVQQ